MSITIPQLKSVREFAKSHPSFSEGSLRWYIQNAPHYGLEKAFVRRGRRVFINEVVFFEEFGLNEKKKAK